MNSNKINSIKNFWNKRPCNIKHSTKEIGSESYFNEVEKRKYFVEPHIPKFADFEKWKGKKVLEIGCGIGTDSVNFARAGAHLTCIDLSDVSLELTKKRFEVFNLVGNFYCGNSEDLSKIVPIEDYDLIYSFGVIHHTENPSKILKEIQKFMGDHTVVKLMLYAKYSWKSFGFFITNGYKFNFNLSKTIQYFAEAQLNCPVANVYTKSSLKLLLKDFKILNIKKDHIFPYVIDDYINYIYNKKLFFKIIPNFVFNFLQKTLGWHYLIALKKT